MYNQFEFKVSEEENAVLQGNSEFTKSLYAELARTPGNVFFSPIAAHAILSLAYQGSKGQTKEAFATVLNVSDVRVAAEGYRDAMSRLNAMRNVTLVLANRVFLQDDFALQKRFKTVAVRDFKSDVELLDFKQASTACASINSWVKDATKDKIENIINPQAVGDSTALILVNAIYFMGNWAKPFDPKKTTTREFYVNDTETIHVEMMASLDHFLYKSDAKLEAQIVQLYYVNRAFSLIVILPNEKNGIDELEKKLARTDLTKITENITKKEIHFYLPKFKIEKTVNLKDVLTKLGLGEVFTSDAQLTGLVEDASRPLFVSEFIQKAFITVDEEGTEAAAATGMRLIRISAKPWFIADHPFVVILQSTHNYVGNILFMGRISDPRY